MNYVKYSEEVFLLIVSLFDSIQEILFLKKNKIPAVFT